MENLGRSLNARYQELLGVPSEFPVDGYPGDYVKELAATVKTENGSKYTAGIGGRGRRIFYPVRGRNIAASDKKSA